MTKSEVTSAHSGYELLDSGAGAKLERYGSKVLIRPSTLCIWKRRRPELWDKADASYEHERGWKFRGPRFEEWDYECPDFVMKLRTQENGQVGLFPEHALYMPKLRSIIENFSADSPATAPQVLNLFAYTGMASIICLKARAHVTHVDLSKKALDWASQNFELNGVAALPLRLIREDALDFVDREVRRNKKYDIIICDPPSFSRITPKKTWQLEEIMLPMMENLAKLLDPKRGALFFTSHHSDLSGPLVSNVLLDLFAGKKLETDSLALSIRESGSPRLLPAGNLISCVLS